MSKKLTDSPSKEDNPDSPAQAKRSTLKKLGVASAVVASAQMAPKEWVKPAIDSVILPAHAQTSEDSDQSPSDNTTTAAPTTAAPTTTAAPVTTTAAPIGDGGN